MIYKKELPREFNEDMTHKFPNKFTSIDSCKQITFYTGAQCTLRCTYCYEQHDTINEVPLTLEAVKPFIDKLFNDEYPEINSKNTEGIIIEFIGGEPFMAIDAIKNITDYFFNYMIYNNHKWLKYTRISISSNGTEYFSPKVQEYIKQYYKFIALGISIDGHKELHDSCRVRVDGTGSFDTAIAAKRYHEKYYHEPVGSKLTFSHDNLSEIYNAIRFMISDGYTEIHANCVYEDVWQPGDNKILYEQLKLVADYIIDNDLYNKVYFSFFDENLGQPKDPNDIDNWCGGVSTSMIIVNSTGDIYTCIRFMECSLQQEQPEIKIGNIHDGFYCTEEQRFHRAGMANVTRKTQSTDECFNCKVANGCAWCSAYNYQITGSYNKRVTFICPMHKARVYANFYYWNKLYSKVGLTQNIFKCNLSDEDIFNIEHGILKYPMED